ncbi:hypothetical protein GCM10023189_08840 [Nibrella saemangeumensis]|uniref:DUF2442 domain-containing protein n=1 Tax=Nibrella saemangeumensis TaxID=1084526 RepID=A0ABP8MID6_9BACT
MKATVKPTESRPTTSGKAGKSRVRRPSFDRLPTITGVKVKADSVWFELNDGRTVTIPIAWSKPLQQATPRQRRQFTVSAYNVFWDEVDEIIGVENILFGNQLYL